MWRWKSGWPSVCTRSRSTTPQLEGCDWWTGGYKINVWPILCLYESHDMAAAGRVMQRLTGQTWLDFCNRLVKLWAPFFSTEPEKRPDRVFPGQQRSDREEKREDGDIIGAVKRVSTELKMRARQERDEDGKATLHKRVWEQTAVGRASSVRLLR